MNEEETILIKNIIENGSPEDFWDYLGEKAVCLGEVSIPAKRYDSYVDWPLAFNLFTAMKKDIKDGKVPNFSRDNFHSLVSERDACQYFLNTRYDSEIYAQAYRCMNTLIVRTYMKEDAAKRIDKMAHAIDEASKNVLDPQRRNDKISDFERLMIYADVPPDIEQTDILGGRWDDTWTDTDAETLSATLSCSLETAQSFIKAFSQIDDAEEYGFSSPITAVDVLDRFSEISSDIFEAICDVYAAEEPESDKRYFYTQVLSNYCQETSCFDESESADAVTEILSLSHSEHADFLNEIKDMYDEENLYLFTDFAVSAMYKALEKKIDLLKLKNPGKIKTKTAQKAKEDIAAFCRDYESLNFRSYGKGRPGDLAAVSDVLGLDSDVAGKFASLAFPLVQEEGKKDELIFTVKSSRLNRDFARFMSDKDIEWDEDMAGRFLGSFTLRWFDYSKNFYFTRNDVNDAIKLVLKDGTLSEKEKKRITDRAVLDGAGLSLTVARANIAVQLFKDIDALDESVPEEEKEILREETLVMVNDDMLETNAETLDGLYEQAEALMITFNKRCKALGGPCDTEKAMLLKDIIEAGDKREAAYRLDTLMKYAGPDPSDASDEPER